MKRKQRDMTNEEFQRFLANKYNDYQNVSIHDSNYNYLDTEFSNEIFQCKEFCDINTKKI